MRFIVLIGLLLLTFTPVYATDDISITYMHEGPPYWYGKGILSSEIEGDEFVLDTNGVEIISFSSGFMPTVREGDRIKFVKVGETSLFELTFLAGKPKGRGLYRLSTGLPRISSDRALVVIIEHGGNALYSDAEFTTWVEGEFLVLTSTYPGDDLFLVFETTRAKNLLVNTVFMALFALGVFVFIFLRYRQEIRETYNLKRLGEVLEGAKSPLGLEETSSGYDLFFDYVRVRNAFNLKNIFRRGNGRLFVSIPHNLIIVVFFLILLTIFANSFLEPFKPHLEDTGLILKAVIFLSLGVAVLAVILAIAMAKTHRQTAAVAGALGGMIILLRVGHIGVLAVPLAIISGLLIYFLSLYFMEESENSAVGEMEGP